MDPGVVATDADRHVWQQMRAFLPLALVSFLRHIVWYPLRAVTIWTPKA